MISRLLHFLKEPTSRDILINTIGSYLNVFFVAFFALILVRIMGPSEYGALSVLLGISYVLANVLDFGTTATIYSSVPTLYIEKDKNLYRFIKSTFFYQSLFSLIVITVLLIAFPALDKSFFKTGESGWVLSLTAISVLLYIWQNFFSNILFAAKRFLRANIYINIANAIKTMVILILAYYHMVTVGVIILVFGVLGPGLFFVMLLYKNKKLIPDMFNAAINKDDFRFSYTLTYFLASQFYNLGLRMDLFLLSYFGLRDQVGFYGLSQKIILTIIASIVSITQVLSPRFATIHSKKTARREFKTAVLYLLIPTWIFIALYLTPKIVFETIFTPKFAQATAITHALAIPFILSALGSIPTLFLLYTAKKPQYILYANILFFIIVTAGSYIWIPSRGAFGPPTAIFIAFVVAVTLQSVAMVGEYRKLPA